MKRAKSKPVSPGIITSRISRSKCRLEQLGARIAGAVGGGDAIALAGEKARQQIADAAVVVDHQQMRRVVGRLRPAVRAMRGSLRHVHAFAVAIARGEDRLQHLVGIVAVDHRAQELRATLSARLGRARRARA